MIRETNDAISCIMELMSIQSPLIALDPWLEPHAQAIIARREHAAAMERRILNGVDVVTFAQGHHFFGLHKTKIGWVFREWMPNATDAYLVGAFSAWQDKPAFRLTKRKDDVWEVTVPLSVLKHKDLFKLHVVWDGGDGYRIPAWATRVVQNPVTLGYDAQVWSPPKPYAWRHTFVRDKNQVPYIYEAHIGMSGKTEKVTSVKEFTKNTLPRIVKAGYNTIQLMAVQEHPYYGSFGYHVSSLFAPSSRFGTPEDLKALVDTAHGAGMSVILDLVHSHAVKNEDEGLSRFDGTYSQYFREGDAGDHIAWDSRLYDYGKPQVAHFLLSNCRYWLEEYNFDGYRFDGVTSMLYFHHGLEKAFTRYDDYFCDVDQDAAGYLTMANSLIHAYRPHAVTVAEEMSGMPGLVALRKNDGFGFDYRLSMGVPDLWIKLIKEQPDEQWSVSMLLHELSQHRPEEKTISYAESHDQALVGDKTLIFRLADSKMYDGMLVTHQDPIIDRAIALHKIIRLMTAGLHQGGYLNFMGNEFGHPEWIDFPREGNGWSYKYARRQWQLADNPKLKYHWLGDFDRAMITLLRAHEDQMRHHVSWTTTNDFDQVMSFMRGDLLFVVNLSPERSYEGYGLYAPQGAYRIVLSSDDHAFGGFGRIDTSVEYHTTKSSERPLRLYIPARTALVLRRTTALLA